MENTPDPKTNSTDGKPATSGSEDNKQGERTFSQEELDRIVQKRVNEVTAKSDEKVKQAVEAALAEQERKAKMSEEDRTAEEQKAREDEIAERERQVTLRERRVEATALLSKKNIPESFVEYVLDEDADKMAEKIEALSKNWSAELKKAVKETVSGQTPEDKGTTDNLGKGTSVSSGVYRGDGNRVI